MEQRKMEPLWKVPLDNSNGDNTAQSSSSQEDWDEAFAVVVAQCVQLKEQLNKAEADDAEKDQRIMQLLRKTPSLRLSWSGGIMGQPW